MLPLAEGGHEPAAHGERDRYVVADAGIHS